MRQRRQERQQARASRWFLVLLALLPGRGDFRAADAPRSAPPSGWASAEPVGPSGPGRVVLPVSQILTPAGRQVALQGFRPQARRQPLGMFNGGGPDQLRPTDEVEIQDLQRDRPEFGFL